jgi:hypothetical protein
MVADAFMKPLQGTLFRKFCDYIMNIDPHTNSASDHRSVLRNHESAITDSTTDGKMTDGATHEAKRNVLLVTYATVVRTETIKDS